VDELLWDLVSVGAIIIGGTSIISLGFQSGDGCGGSDGGVLGA